MKKQKFRSDFLFPNTGFVTGMGSAMNLAGNFYDFNTSKTEQQADTKALMTDWTAVGQDIKEAINKLKQEVNY